MKLLVKKILNHFGYEPVRTEDFQRLVEFSKCQIPSASLWSVLDRSKRVLIQQFMEQSKAQLAQDLFVLSELGANSSDNFFVEFGATNGIDLSNTWLLEKVFGWQGILAEPARIWHPQLSENRSCRIDRRCVYDQSGRTLSFTETQSAELSGITGDLHKSDQHTINRAVGNSTYEVETVSLNDLLSESGAPNQIGYLSVDTEGSEFNILSAVDFNRWKFRVITVEHNFCEPTRSRIRSLLERNGYQQRHSSISRWDDWFVLMD